MFLRLLRSGARNVAIVLGKERNVIALVYIKLKIIATSLGKSCTASLIGYV